jgi:hypothetical protein
MDENTLIALFCSVDDFCKAFEPQWSQFLLEQNTTGTRWWTTRKSKLSMSELMTIVILFHSSGYRTFKHYYNSFVTSSLKSYFHELVSYRSFNKLMKQLVLPLFVFQQTIAGKTEGIAFIDSTVLSVCHICRASSHKVFRNIAKKGKSTTGWFFGMKLHLVINHKAEIVSWIITPGNIDDRKPVPYLVQNLFGKVFGDRGYIGKELFERLYADGIQLITRLKLNMKNILMDVFDKLLLYKRGIIESVNNQLKIVCQIDHHRHRSVVNFMTNLISGLVAYSLNPHKPHIQNLDFKNSLG